MPALEFQVLIQIVQSYPLKALTLVLALLVADTGVVFARDCRFFVTEQNALGCPLLC